METVPSTFDLPELLDHAERVLAESLHPALARMVVDLARASAHANTRSEPTMRPTVEQAAPAPSVELLTTRDAATRLRVSEKQIYRLVAAGKIRSSLIGHRHRFQSADLDAYISSIHPVARRVRAARLMSDPRLGVGADRRRTA